MTHRNLSRLGRWAARGAWTALVLALLLPLVAFLVDFGWGRDVLLIAPHDPAVVTLNRSLWSAGDPVPDLYGSPMSTPTRVLVFRGDAVVHPEEDPTLALLPAASAGRRPIQAQTLWWAVRLGEAALGGLVVALLVLNLFLRRRERRAVRAAAA